MQELYQSLEYKELIIKNNYNTLEFLLKKGIDFGIFAYSQPIKFNPKIPEDIFVFDKLVLFIISGYSKESAHLDNSTFSFEAGFGESNFGSHLTVPLEAIAQIAIDRDIISVSQYIPKKDEQPKNSMDLLLNNPENQTLLKKLQKSKKD